MYPLHQLRLGAKSLSLGSLGCHQHALRFKEAYAEHRFPRYRASMPIYKASS